MDESTSDSGRRSGERRPGSEARPPIWRSEELFQGRREVWIEHGQQMYRLRITSSGKLYLTK